ncbi:MAG: exonuclease domain-containing protein [Nonlabens sp.]
MYAILDIEGTGGKYNEEGITEIAIYQFDGQKVTDQFASLVNPERKIDPFVTKLTGISNKMLVRAPKFYELAKRIVEITEDCVIVAHNTDFDLRILQLEFDRLGYKFDRTTLCTVELSQKLLPDQNSYSLGKLVRSLGIPITDRHRATGDALATLKLFQLLLGKDEDQEILKQTFKRKTRVVLPKNLKQILDNIPSVTGVYSIYNNQDEIIYLGKGKNVKSQVNRHFTKQTKLNKLLVKNVENVAVENMGNELIASIKEHESVKKLKPLYNKKRRKPLYNHGLTIYRDDNGYKSLIIEKAVTNKEYNLTFSNRKAGLNFVEKFYRKEKLCFQKSNIAEPCPWCLNQECVEDLAEHNLTIDQFLQTYSILNKNGIIKARGREATERGVVWIENGRVMGYSFSKLKIQIVDRSMLHKINIPVRYEKDARHIVEQYLRTQKRYQVSDHY